MLSIAPACHGLLSRTTERHLRRTHPHVAGLDECGVGAIAGPVVAAAVLLPESDDAAAWLPAGDCKSLSRAARLDAYERLRAAPRVLWSCAAVDHRAVDSLGPQAAAHAAMRLAAARLERKACRSCFYYLVDGEAVPAGLRGEAHVRCDQSEACVAAASIVASVAHEVAMRSLGRRHGLWDLPTNLGWPSRQHMRLLLRHGPSGCHRGSCFPFAPRYGRRLASHPDRAAYTVVQRELRRARSEDAVAGGGGAGGSGSDGADVCSDSDGAEAGGGSGKGGGGEGGGEEGGGGGEGGGGRDQPAGAEEARRRRYLELAGRIEAARAPGAGGGGTRGGRHEAGSASSVRGRRRRRRRPSTH